MQILCLWLSSKLSVNAVNFSNQLAGCPTKEESVPCWPTTTTKTETIRQNENIWSFVFYKELKKEGAEDLSFRSETTAKKQEKIIPMSYICFPLFCSVFLKYTNNKIIKCIL